MTRGQYASHVLKGIGAPITLHTRRALQTQMQCEGGDAENNPFNTTQKMPLSWNYNWNGGFPVQNYTTAQEGIDATVKTLGYHDFARVRGAMKRNESARRIVRLIGESPWGTSDQLLREVLEWVIRVPGVLRMLERKQVAPY
jgi:hypothetical protein